MSAIVRRIAVALIGNVVTKEMTEALLRGVFVRLRERARLTPTTIDDRAIDTLEAAFDIPTAAQTISDWLNARLRSA